MEITIDVLTIGQKDYSVEITELPQADLKFYPENPRVYSVLNFNGEPTQDEIEKYMCSQEHVKQLKESIFSNGGLIDPLIVRGGDLTVLEGNSRLAAYRLLCQKDPIAWGKVKCKILPSDIPEEAIFALLGQYHIIGRKDWDPFEQANYLYRRHQQTKLPIEYMANELGISKQKATKMIEVIEFMIAHNDLNKRNWSYYEEYLKNAGIKKYRETSESLDDTIAKAIQTGEIHEASDIRKLGEIAKVGDKQSKRIMNEIASGEIDMYEGYSSVQDAGKLDDVVKKLKAFRRMIIEPSFEKGLRATEEIFNNSSYEIKKIIKELEKIKQKIDKCEK